MRTKLVTVGEKEYTIASLSVGQVDEIIFASADVRREQQKVSAQVQGSQRFVKGQVCAAIAASLNNIVMGDGRWFARSSPWLAPTGKDERWTTPDDVFGDLLYDECMELYAEVAKLSGLKSSIEEVKKGNAKLGEEDAALAK